MKTTADRFGWGLMLIVAGGVFMAHNLGYQIDVTPIAGMAVAVGLSGLSFMHYFAGDHNQWERLIPACLLAAIAAMIGLSEAHVRDSIIAVPLFFGLAIPFAVALSIEPQKNYRAAVPLTIFTVLALVALLENHLSDTLLVAVATSVIAGPFFFIYFTQPKQWWALMPAGVLSSIGLTALLVALDPLLEHSNVTGAIAALGIAATFGALYLRRSLHPTGWAKTPAIVFSFIALLALLNNTGIDGGPLVLITLGVILLVNSLRPHQAIVS